MSPIEMVYMGCLMLGGGYLVLASALHFLVGGGGGDHDIDVSDGLDHGDLHLGDGGVELGDGAVDLDADGDLDLDHGDGADGHLESDQHGVSFFSPLVLSTLLFGFGVMGFVVEHWVVQAALISLAAATAMAAVSGGGTFWGINKLRSVEGGSQTQLRTLLGSSAQVSVAIPAQGHGEIVYVHNQSRFNAPARSGQDVDIPRGSKVLIGSIDGPIFVVEEAGSSRRKRLAAPKKQ